MQPWDLFFKEKIVKIFIPRRIIVDIGGGLRVKKDSGNRYDYKREWIRPLLEKVDYKIIDPVPDYRPDLVGNIHHLPLDSNSVDAILCLAVLEHVEDPPKAISEILRVLKPGGYCLLYVPFLFYYHAEGSYYKDYWRFTEDGLKLLVKDFSNIEISPVRGRLATWLHLSPFGKNRLVAYLAVFIDKISQGLKSKQVSGYYVFLVK